VISHVTVLTNPASGHGNAPHAAERAIAQWQRRGLDTVEIVGRDGAHARELLRDALDRGTDAVAVTGGDGVIALALQELAGGRVPLAIVPAGTGNDHARAFGIPCDNPEAAADLLLDGHCRTVDLGRIDGPDGTSKWFGTVVATGFDALVSDRANRMRWPRGRMRYNVAMIAELSRLRLLPFRLSFDDGPTEDVHLTMTAIGNTRSYGGGMLICPYADPTDGLLDVTMISSASRTRLVRLFPTVFKGTHVDLDTVSTRWARTVAVECPGINAYADGDFACALPARITAVPDALRIVTPA